MKYNILDFLDFITDKGLGQNESNRYSICMKVIEEFYLVTKENERKNKKNIK